MQHTTVIGISFVNQCSFSRTVDPYMSQEKIIEFMKHEFGEMNAGELDQIIIISVGRVITLTKF